MDWNIQIANVISKQKNLLKVILFENLFALKAVHVLDFLTEIKLTLKVQNFWKTVLSYLLAKLFLSSDLSVDVELARSGSGTRTHDLKKRKLKICKLFQL